MPEPTREDAIATLEDGYREINAVLAQLSDEELTKPATIGGGDWSGKDLIGHIAYWEELALEALEEWRRGQRPRIEDVFRDRAVDRVNEERVERDRAIPLGELEDKAEATHRKLISTIESISDEEWHTQAPYATERRTTLAMLLGSITAAPKRPFGHAFAHLPDLEAYEASVRSST